MPQNNFKSKVRRAIWRLIPAEVLHVVFRDQFHGMTHEIESAGIVSGTETTIAGVNEAIYRLDLADGTVIISTAPTANNVKITHRARRKLSLGSAFSKALVDTVVRYRYPHSMVPILSIPVSDRQRGGFHLQHRNLPQETGDFTASQKAFLIANFTPRSGWNILDIGCYLGHGTTHIAQAVGASGRVIAVEAIPSNAAIATAQLSENKLDHCCVVNRAIWRKAGEVVQLNATENQANAIASDVISSSRKIDITTTSLAELTEIIGAPVDLVSLTVNGAEVEALECLSDMPLATRPRRLIMPGWYPTDESPRSDILQKMLNEHGYETLVTKHRFVIAWLPGALK